MKQGEVLQKRYCIESLLGKGSSGTVYLAKDLHLNKDRAIKCVEVAHSGTEIEILKEIKHEGFPIVTDTFWEGDVQCIVMEYIEGKNLKEWREEKEICREDEIGKIILQIADLLDCLHQNRKQILYLDLKPENIMLTGDGKIRLIDFGAALCESETYTQKKIQRFGTLGYASPEQIRAEQEIDVRSDIYSLGAVMYYLATGEEPLKLDIWQKNESAKTTALSSAFSRMIETCLEEKKENRYRNMEALKKALKESSKKGKREEIMIKCHQILYYASTVAFCVLSGAFIEQLIIEQWNVNFEMGYSILLLYILHYLTKTCLQKKKRKQTSYRILCKHFYTDKKGIGLLTGFLAAGFLVEFILIFGFTEEESILWVTDSYNRRVLIQQNSVYYYKEPFRLECRNQKGKVFYQVAAEGGKWNNLEKNEISTMIKNIYKEKSIKLSFREIDLSKQIKRIYKQNFTLIWKDEKTPAISKADITGVSSIKIARR